MDEKAVVDAGKWVWDNWTQIAERLRSLREWFAGSRSSILVVGGGGVGKSTLAKLLAAKGDLLVSLAAPYSESTTIEKYRFDERGSEVVVPPGQEKRRDFLWREPLSEIARGKVRGIIVVNSYGYHSLANLALKDHRLFRGNKRQFLADYLEEQRADELRVLRRIAPFVRDARSRIWMLSLIGKQDLWWNKAKEVSTFYESGPYSNAVRGIAAKRGDVGFRHEFAYGSFLIANFIAEGGGTLAKNVSGFDQLAQAASIRRVIETLDALRRWEEGKCP